MIPNKDKVNEWIGRAYATAKEHGFHNTEHKTGHWLMLINSEITESMEADRKGLRSWKTDDLTRLFEISKEDSWFECTFYNLVKDTHEDELADIVIRCCDYLGCKGLTFEDSFERPDKFHNGFYETFAEKAWDWVEILTNKDFSVQKKVSALIYEVLLYCEELNIDIEKHVEWKMRYNQQRPPKHGKAY